MDDLYAQMLEWRDMLNYNSDEDEFLIEPCDYEVYGANKLVVFANNTQQKWKNAYPTHDVLVEYDTLNDVIKVSIRRR